MNKRIAKKKGLLKIREEELWSLDVTLAKYILPRLQKYRNMERMGYPIGLSDGKEWNEILDKMIYAFEYVVKRDESVVYTDYDEEMKKREKYKEGICLFAKYFMELWD
ncbi:hypothetical protein ACOT7R_09080 [Clostridium perfringens]|uniref:hypothetical protein n=1 Tax=Clostridium perfringens TaxID=1502 RepID=UPI003BAC4447